MFARRNEDLGSADGEAAVSLRFRPGSDQAQIGTALRLGQVHRSGPLARNHLRQVKRLLLGRALGKQRAHRAAREAGVHRESLIGGAEEFLDGKSEHMRQPLPAEFLRQRQGSPTRFDELPIGVGEPGGRGDHPVRAARAALPIAGQIQWRADFGGKPARLVEHGCHQIRRRRRERGQIGILRNGEHFVDHEPGITGGSLVAGHDALLYECRLIGNSSVSMVATKSDSSAIAASRSSRCRRNWPIFSRHLITATRRCSTRPSPRS